MGISYRHLFVPCALVLLTIACLSTDTSPAKAGQIFFSTSNSISGGIAPGNPVINLPSASGSGALYIWVTDDTPVTPPVGQQGTPFPNSSAAFPVRLAQSGNAATLTGGSVYNFNLHSTAAPAGTDLGPSAVNRWNQVSVTPSMSGDINAVTAAFVAQAGPGSPGINPLNDGVHLNPGSATNGTLDVGYNVPAHVFLYGELDYNVVGVGSTTFNLQPSPLKIIVGHDGINQDLTNQFSYGSAVVNVVPEPASGLLLGLGTAGLCWFGFRRREAR